MEGKENINMYNLLMIQHTNEGDVVSCLSYQTVDEWKGKYHHEMDYAISNESIKGLSVIVTDNNCNVIFRDTWYREGVATKTTSVINQGD